MSLERQSVQRPSWQNLVADENAAMAVILKMIQGHELSGNYARFLLPPECLPLNRGLRSKGEPAP